MVPGENSQRIPGTELKERPNGPADLQGSFLGVGTSWFGHDRSVTETSLTGEKPCHVQQAVTRSTHASRRQLVA